MSDPGPRTDGATFDGASFDLDAYLARIGYSGSRTATLQTLQEIAVLHPRAIPFESLDALLRVPIELDAPSLQRKLVQRRRGGWCYEQNLLLGHALTALGYRVTGLSARVAWQVPPGMIRPRTHMLLRVDLGQSYLVDAGFGGLTLTGVLRLEPDVEQSTPHEPFRLRGHKWGLAMEARVRGEWRPLYVFDLQPQAFTDYESTNWYLANHPRSHFLATLIAARAEKDRRYALLNGELSVHHLGGKSERRVLASAAEIRRVLDELFLVDVPPGPEVDAALERLLPVTL
jgi:N-hydroxyarylamine O-acetyltransferase